MKYLALIQARCGSSRLPQKVMMPLGGKPSLQQTIERAGMSKYLDEVMVVTSIEKQNTPIVKLCCDLGIRVFAGSEEDVLDRYYQAAKLLKPEYVVRITGDCPLYDVRFLDYAINQMNTDADYIWQGQPETFADGLDIEIISFSALKLSWEKARLTSEREHVTQYIRKHPDRFRIKEVKCPLGDLGNERWTLDEQSDYVFLCKIFDHFSSKGVHYPFSEKIVAYLDANPEVRLINSSIIRDEGLVKSLKNDKAVDI